MRYGVVRTSPDLPSLGQQRSLIERAGCDLVLEDTEPTALSHRGLLQLLFGLKRGDTVLIHGLEIFGLTTGELARLLRRLLEAGVTLEIVGGTQPESLAPNGATPRALALLADHETRRPTRLRGRGRSQGLEGLLAPDARGGAPPPNHDRRPDTALTQYQLRFARSMHRHGHSVRSIGLLFRLSPSEMARRLLTDGERLEDDEPDSPDAPTETAPRR